jgi:hypothetical protein
VKAGVKDAIRSQLLEESEEEKLEAKMMWRLLTESYH